MEINPSIIGIFSPLVIALVEGLKQTGLPSRYCFIVSLVLGIGFGILASQGDFMGKFITGLIIGCTASGLYAGTRAIAGK